MDSTLHQAVLLLFAGLMLAGGWSDARRLILPNRLALAALALYPAHVLTSPAPVNWLGALAVAAIIFVLGFVCFVLRYAGGGDVKFFTVGSLWAGPALMPEFLMVTSLVGAAMALGMIAHRMRGRLTPAHATVGATDASANSLPRPALPLRTRLAAAVLLGVGLVAHRIWLGPAKRYAGSGQAEPPPAPVPVRAAKPRTERDVPYGVAIAAGATEVVVMLLIGR